MPNLRLTNDATVHHDDPNVLWLSTLCGLRRTLEDRKRLALTSTYDPVDCMTCLVLAARFTR